MALQGTLKDFSLADIFQLIGLQKKTGVLTLKSGQEVVTVSFLDGNVVAADSRHRRLEDRLGTVLVRSKQITQAQLQEALRVQKQNLRRLGNVLVEQKFIRQETLQEALRIQVTQMIYRLFRWRDGDYQFSQEERLDYDRENVVPLSAESILMEGARILDEWPIIEKRIGSLASIYRRTPAAQEALAAGGGEPAVVLNSEEKMILDALDRQRSIQDLIEGSPLSEFDTCRVLYELVGRYLAEKITVGELISPTAGKPRPVETAPRATLSAGMGLLLAVLAAISFATSFNNPLNGLSVLSGSHPTVVHYLQQVSRTRLERLDYAVQVYYLENRGYPQDLNYLVVGRLLAPEDLRDPWGREYLYKPLVMAYEIQGFSARGNPDSTLEIRTTLSH